MSVLEQDSLPLPTFTVDAAGTFDHGNAAWREVAGEVAFVEAVAPSRREAVHATLSAGMSGGSPFRFTADLRRRDGMYSLFHLHARPKSGEPAGAQEGQGGRNERSRRNEWVVVAVEVEGETLEGAPSQARSSHADTDAGPVVTPTAATIEDFRLQMLGLVGHDLRNPLNTVVMAASLVRSRAKSEPEVRLIERVIHAADRLTRMITELLDFTACRLGGRIDLVRDPGDLSAIVAETTRDIAAARKVTVEMDLAVTPQRSWDATRIEQIVTNLVLNAVLHGKAPVRVTVRELPDGTASLLEVHDVGGGLDADARQQLFAPTRKRLSVTREAGSLGLGLYVTEQIVQAFGGRIDVRSSPDEGTVFAVLLPHV